ncbi:MAG: UvrD-helicase domain-containing protein, partial [Desulfobacteraceae bacterium]|nr:UvrD-helicase domain-containing protein [Desulfobacteraceae bacterium]
MVDAIVQGFFPPSRGQCSLMQPFDAIKSPLNGTCLIEAGAGTGKTHTITTLVLRLILEEALLPEQILVVTFTTAATAELRDRVRRRLQDARHILQGRSSGDAVLGVLLDRSGPREIALARIEDALANFDRMPVFTIHGFCHRVLNEMAFETGNGFDAELVTDARSIIQGLADDFWRRTWHEASPELLYVAFKTIKNPDDLAQRYSRYAIPDLKILPDPPHLIPVSSAVFLERCAETRQQWDQYRDTVLPMLASPNLKANIYGSLDRHVSRDDSRSKRDEKIDSWRHQMDRCAQSSTGGLPLPEALTYLSQTKVDASTKKGTEAPQHPFFIGCDRLREEAQQLETAIQQWLIALQVRFFHVIDEELARYKQDNQVLFFDDLLLLVRNALQQDHSGQLSGMLRSRYRAVLIDEFQDTDPVQYAIFKTLFATGDHRMFLIGDPKQSIYSFRGADIVTYLEAAQSAENRFTLTQ